MPYLLMFLGVLLFGLGFWMLQNQKSRPEPARIEQIQTEKEETKPRKPAEPSNQEKGLAFEKFVVSCFNRKYFSLKQWQGDKYHKGRFAEATQQPDLLLEFELKGEKHPFAVECKWKAQLPEKHEWAEQRQIENYQKFASESQLPVFVILGFGGSPSEPQSVYILPLSKLKYSEVRKAYLEPFKREISDQRFFYEPDHKILR